jgi:hypothetical protein
VSPTSIGLVGIASFRRGAGFKSAVVAYIVLFDIGVAIGHVRQAVLHGDYAANNFGLLLGLTVLQAVLLPVLLWRVLLWHATSRSIDPTPAAAFAEDR